MNLLNETAKKNALLAALAVLTLASGSVTCLAGTPDPEAPGVITLKYSPLDLATPAGTAALYDRIKAAAVNVCEPFKSRELSRRAVWQKCYSLAVTNAVAAAHQPTLTAFHESHARVSRPG